MSLGRRTVLAFAPQAVAILSALVMSVITARLLGPEGRGQLAVALLTVSTIVLVADGGLSSALTYFVSKRSLKPEQATALSAVAALVVGGSVAALAVAAHPLLSEWILSGVGWRVHALAMLSVPGSLYLMFWTRNRMATGDYATPALAQTVLSLGAAAVAAAVLLALKGGVLELVAALSVMYLVAFVVLFCADVMRHGVAWGVPAAAVRDIVAFCGRSYVGNLVSYAGLRVDTYVLNAFRGPADVGLYSIAVTISEKLWLVDSSVGQATLPEVVSREGDRAAALVASANRLVVLVTSVVALVAFVLAPAIVLALYGTDYLPAAQALRILLPGAVAYASGRTLLQYHHGHLGRPGTVSWVMAASSAVGLAGYFVLVPAYGIVGAAAASSAAYGVVFACGLALFTRASGTPAVTALVPRTADVRALLATARKGLGRD